MCISVWRQDYLRAVQHPTIILILIFVAGRPPPFARTGILSVTSFITLKRIQMHICVVYHFDGN